MEQVDFLKILADEVERSALRFMPKERVTALWLFSFSYPMLALRLLQRRDQTIYAASHRSIISFDELMRIFSRLGYPDAPWLIKELIPQEAASRQEVKALLYSLNLWDEQDIEEHCEAVMSVNYLICRR